MDFRLRHVHFHRSLMLASEDTFLCVQEVDLDSLRRYHFMCPFLIVVVMVLNHPIEDLPQCALEWLTDRQREFVYDIEDIYKTIESDSHSKQTLCDFIMAMLFCLRMFSLLAPKWFFIDGDIRGQAPYSIRDRLNRQINRLDSESE